MFTSLQIFVVGIVTAAKLDATSAISPAQLEQIWDINDVADTGNIRRRMQSSSGKLNMPDSWYNKCVRWVNSARSSEGLPALQRWTDFEPCTDRGAEYDSRTKGFHGSIEKNMFCDFKSYRPAQSSCPNWHYTSDALETCTLSMWDQKKNVQLYVTNDGKEELRCKDGRSIEECAPHYLNLRGGHLGYNSFDRVACGFYKNGDQVWINMNFGSGEKVNVADLLTADKWEAPTGWQPQNYQKYGFACGGDKNSRPTTLLQEDCQPLADDFQYATCAGDYYQDYRFWACTYGRCDPNYKGECRDFTVGEGRKLFSNGEGKDVCSDIDTDDVLSVGIDIPRKCVDPRFRVGSGVFSYKYSEVCRRTCKSCSCPRMFSVGFSGVAPTSKPTVKVTPPPTNTPRPSIEATSRPTNAKKNRGGKDNRSRKSDRKAKNKAKRQAAKKESGKAKVTECDQLTTRRQCKNTLKCMFFRGNCKSFSGECAGLSNKECIGANGCKWASSDRACEAVDISD